MDPTSIMKTLSAKEEALLLQITKLKNELESTNLTLDELRKSKESLESLVRSIASKWVSSPDDNHSKEQNIPQETKKTKSKRVSKKKVKPEPEVEHEPEPGVEEETKVEPEVQEESETTTNEEKADTEDEGGFIVSYKGVDYVVFPDNLDVIREDDKEEEVVGRWDSDNKVIVFN